MPSGSSTASGDALVVLRIEEWIASIQACGPRALRLQKRLVNDWDRMSTTDAARAGIQAFADAYRTDEPRRVMLAFLERRRTHRQGGAGAQSGTWREAIVPTRRTGRRLSSTMAPVTSAVTAGDVPPCRPPFGDQAAGGASSRASRRWPRPSPARGRGRGATAAPR